MILMILIKNSEFEFLEKFIDDLISYEEKISNRIANDNLNN